jgi:hypothetical protein
MTMVGIESFGTTYPWPWGFLWYTHFSLGPGSVQNLFKVPGVPYMDDLSEIPSGYLT